MVRQNEKEPADCNSASSTSTNVLDLHVYDTTIAPLCQDTPEQELTVKFQPKKLLSLQLAACYERLGYQSKAFRTADCGSFLEFARTAGGGGIADLRGDPTGILASRNPHHADSKFKLHNANFCRDRLCPMCSWRRSYKIFGQVSQIMNAIGSKYTYLFLTLTIPNCSPDDLSSVLSDLQKSWNRFIGYKRIRDAVRGFFKALEVTRNPVTGFYHPHFHVVLAVDKKYFKDKRYISRDEWLQLWQKAARDSSITQVDIRRAKSKKTADGENAVAALSSAVAEIAKYAVKSADYLFEDPALTDEVVSVLVPALNNRRLCSFGGVFEDVRRQLKLDDAEDGDLVHLDGDLNSDLAIQIYRYGWSAGAYKLIEVIDHSSLESGVT